MTMFKMVCTTVIGLMGALPVRAQISTGFEASQGYAPTGGVLRNGTEVTGTVIGQPSGGGHTWFTYSGDNRHAFLVREGVGYGGTQGLISQQVIGNALWNPTTGVLDGVQTEFLFGFKFRFIDPPFRNGEEWDGFFGFRLDDTNANGSHFEVYLNAGEGRVRATSRTAAGEWLNVRLVDAQNQPFAAQQNVWYEVWGNGSYVTDTYSVYVREAGNSSATLYKRENLPFRYHGLGTGTITPGPRVQDDDIVRLYQAKTDSALYRQIALDDVYYLPIPEPAAAMLALGGLGAVAALRRSQRLRARVVRR